MAETEPLRPVVLVVDDDPEIRASLRFFFEDAGYEVEEADDGAQALAQLRMDAKSWVVLLDKMMPRLDGPQTLLRFSTEAADVRSRTRIIFMTARSDPPEPEIAGLIQRYTTGYITKPFNLESLLAAVERASTQLAEQTAGKSS